MSELGKLEQKVATIYELQKARRRELYAYAKANGFSALEAQVLSGRSKKAIDQLSKERK
jgi:hypothetical protein